MDNQPDRSLRSKLNKMFSRYDYVGIENILSKKFEWDVALEQNEILGMSQADPMNEERMAQSGSGQFLPGEAVVRGQKKVTRFVLQPGEKKMVIGEAAYVLIPRIFNAFIREKYGTSKSSLAKFRNPTVQDELMPIIAIGPVINNVQQAMQTFVNTKMGELEGFSDVQTKPSIPNEPGAPAPRGFADPAVRAKALAARQAKRNESGTPVETA